MSRTEKQWMAPPAEKAENYVANAIYTDEGIFAEEMENIFGRVWKFVCYETELPEAGDYRTTMVAGKPLVIVRGDDGNIRTFYNVCPHRGAEIVRKPSGNGKNFTCLFHHWTFDRQGECVSIPLPDGYEDAGVSKEGQSLREVRTEIRLGFIFVNLDDEAGSLDDYLNGALEFAEAPFSDGKMEVFHFHRAVIDGNWKHWMDTDRELYHLFLHNLNVRTSMKTDGFAERKINIYKGGHMAAGPQTYDFNRWEYSRRDDRPEGLPGFGANESRIINIFPDMLVNMKASVVRSDCVIPVSPTRTIIECRGFALKSDTAELRRIRVNDHNEYWGPFGRNLPEDMLAISEQMKALRDGSAQYALFARDHSDGAVYGDATVRDYYRAWGEWMGRPAHDPLNRAEKIRGAA